MSYSFRNYTKAQKVQAYVFNNKSAIRPDALFSDGTKEYRMPAEPMPGDEVTLKFRAALANVDSVYVICNGERYKMEIEESDTSFDYFAVKLPPIGEEKIEYYFEVTSGNATCFYNKIGG